MKSFASIHPASLSSAAVTVASADVHPAALMFTAVPPARKLVTVPVSMLSSSSARKVPVLNASATVGTAQTSKIAPGTEDAADAMLMRGDAVLSVSASFAAGTIFSFRSVPTQLALAIGTSAAGAIFDI